MTDAEKIRILAERVMKWEIMDPNAFGWVCKQRRIEDVSGILVSGLGDESHRFFRASRPCVADAEWNPLESIADFWMLTEPMRGLGFVLTAQQAADDGSWEMRWWEINRDHGYASSLFRSAKNQSAARAGCDAALKAIGVEL